MEVQTLLGESLPRIEILSWILSATKRASHRPTISLNKQTLKTTMSEILNLQSEIVKVRFGKFSPKKDGK